MTSTGKSRPPPHSRSMRREAEIRTARKRDPSVPVELPKQAHRQRETNEPAQSASSSTFTPHKNDDHFPAEATLADGVVSAFRSPSTNWIAASMYCANAGVSNRAGVCPSAQLKTRPFP